MLLTLRRNRTTRFLVKFTEISLLALLFSVVLVSVSLAQEPTPHQAQAVTLLAELLQEAEQNNPQIQAARQGWKAAQQVPTQVSTLPDPHLASAARARLPDIRTAISRTSV